MARPMMNPLIRFGDVLPILDKAVKDEGMIFQAVDERQAIHVCHRLNQCRSALRSYDPQAPLEYDKFVIRVIGDQIHIAPRPTYDLSRSTKLDGSPLSRDVPEYIMEYMRKQSLKDVQAGRPYDPNKKFDIDELMGRDPLDLLKESE